MAEAELQEDTQDRDLGDEEQDGMRNKLHDDGETYVFPLIGGGSIYVHVPDLCNVISIRDYKRFSEWWSIVGEALIDTYEIERKREEQPKPKKNDETYPAFVCVDCGGPRSGLSGKRCAKCYKDRARQRERDKKEKQKQEEVVEIEESLPPLRDGYCKVCRIVRLSISDTTGICDGCA